MRDITPPPSKRAKLVAKKIVEEAALLIPKKSVGKVGQSERFVYQRSAVHQYLIDVLAAAFVISTILIVIMRCWR